LGYREVTTTQDTVILPAGESVRGHEFHYSEWVGRDESQPAPYTVHRRNSEDTWPEGIMRGNVLASYIHLHFGANPRIAPHFVEQCRTWQQSVVV
ncbi:MAG: cobyrinate a,c-diamide synthase, partial [Chloroflexota bacterium]